MAESVDALVSNTNDSNIVPVRPRLRAPEKIPNSWFAIVWGFYFARRVRILSAFLPKSGNRWNFLGLITLSDRQTSRSRSSPFRRRVGCRSFVKRILPTETEWDTGKSGRHNKMCDIRHFRRWGRHRSAKNL